jgi:hypothetical protein
MRPAVFLGTNITRIKSINNQIKNYKNKQGRIPATATRMTAPINRLIQKMIDKGIAEKKIDRHGKIVIQGKARYD